jgi:hypothetical protein
MSRTIYIANNGDDRNDGFVTPVYSWKRALRLKSGDNSIAMHIDGAALKRIHKEIVKREAKRKRWQRTT